MLFFSAFIANYVLLSRLNQEEWGERTIWHAWESREKCTRFWQEGQKEREHSEDRSMLDVGIRLNL
jgi:hypothetical protein